MQNLYGLSDAQLEYQIEDRCSFQQFLGLARQQRVADTKTCWAFKHRLAALGLMASLFEQLSLNQAAYITRKGQIVASSIIPALLPRKRWNDSNTSKDVWADSAYRSEEKAAFLKAQG